MSQLRSNKHAPAEHPGLILFATPPRGGDITPQATPVPGKARGSSRALRLYFYYFVETGFLCVALAALESTT